MVGKTSRLFRRFPNSQHKEKSCILISALMFAILNALKIALANTFILPTDFWVTLSFKFIYSFFTLSILYYFVFKSEKPYIFVYLYIVQIVYFCVQLSYYRLFHYYLHISVIINLFREGLKAINLSVLKDVKLLVLFIDLPIFIYINRRYTEIRNKFKSRNTKIITIYLIAIMMGIGASSIITSNNIIVYLKDERIGQTAIVNRYGTLINTIVDFIENISEEGILKDIRYANAITSNGCKQDKPNFVIIQIESMDSKIVNEKYKGQYITPYLNTLKNTSIYYPYMLCYHSVGGTSDCEISILNGIEPPENFPIAKSTKYDYPNSLVKSLTKYGYNAHAFHANEGSFYNRDIAFYKMGFNGFDDIGNMGLKERGWGAPDHQLFDYIKGRLSDQIDPFFYYIITMSSHDPYYIVKGYYNNPDYNDIEDKWLRNYYNSMSYVDKAIEEFVSYLTTNLENTYIFIFGDHVPVNITTTLYEPSLIVEDDNYLEFVPLYIITPDNKVYFEKERVASGFDIMPTILEASGIPFAIRSYGTDLIDMPVKHETVVKKSQTYNRMHLYTKINNQVFSQELGK